MKKHRLLYIDNLRILLMVLVILHHLAITYGGPGSWYYKEGDPGMIASIIYTFFLAMNQSFFMGFFFLISGYFTPSSYERKGAVNFMKDRLLRLGIPLLTYVVLVDPLINYALAVTLNGFKGTVLDFAAANLYRYSSIGSGPLWFVEALLIFSFIYVVWRSIVKAKFELKIPNDLYIASFALALAASTFAVRIFFPIGHNFVLLNFQFPYFIQYTALFYIGTIAYDGDWLERFPKSSARLWRRVLAALVLALPIVFILGAPDGETEAFSGGFSWQAIVLPLWEQFFAISMIITLTVLFRDRFNRQTSLLSEISGSVYTAYLIHAPVLVALGLMLRDLDLHLLMKFVLLAPLAVGACFFIGNLLRKIPVARNIL